MPKFARILVPSLLFLFASFGILGIAVTACSQNHQQTTIHVSLTSLNGARDAFFAWDGKHQSDIIAKATSHEDGVAKLAAYREERAKAVTGFEAAYRALAIAADSKSDPSIREAVMEAAKVIVSLRGLGVPGLGVPGL